MFRSQNKAQRKKKTQREKTRNKKTQRKKLNLDWLSLNPNPKIMPLSIE